MEPGRAQQQAPRAPSAGKANRTREHTRTDRWNQRFAIGRRLNTHHPPSSRRHELRLQRCMSLRPPTGLQHRTLNSAPNRRLVGTNPKPILTWCTLTSGPCCNLHHLWCTGSAEMYDSNGDVLTKCTARNVPGNVYEKLRQRYGKEQPVRSLAHARTLSLVGSIILGP